MKTYCIAPWIEPFDTFVVFVYIVLRHQKQSKSVNLTMFPAYKKKKKNQLHKKQMNQLHPVREQGFSFSCLQS